MLAFKNKKLLLGLGALVLLLIGFFFFGPGPQNFLMDGIGPPPENPQDRIQWLSDNIDNMDHEKFVILDESLPSWKQLDKLFKSIEPKQNYPEFIKATQTYGTLPNLVEVLYFGDVLKDLGINTQFIHANHWYKNGQFELWYQNYKSPMNLNQDQSKRALVHNILLAKKQGLAVILFPDYYQLEDGGMNKLGISTDLEERLETIALNLAEIAEKYQVEYLVPSNQIEMLFESNGYSIKEAQDRTNAFYASLVPKIRQIYSGKILYKMGGFGNWSNYDGISLEGADLFGFTGCYNRRGNDINFVTQDIKIAALKANQLSQKYNVPWFNAEFVISDDPSPRYSEPTTPPPPIEDYYHATLTTSNQYATPNGATGFTIHSLLGSGKVYDTPAMSLIKDFFAKY